MVHNILLLFLSDVKVVKDAEQGGKKLSEPANYPGIGKTMTTNESAVRYLAQENEKNSAIVRLDKIFAFATNKIRKLYVGQKNAEDENWAKDAVDEKGNKLTHLDYFKYRLRTEGIIDDIDSCITEDDAVAGTVGTVCPFDEETDDVKQTMMTIVGMANRIQAYIQSLPPAEQEAVVLHADMTGGFRHASMMMLAVMRLMQYQGVKIGHVVYSNYNWDLKEGTVQEIGDIYHMFDLVAGAEEFVTFGSVNTIKDYFAKPNYAGDNTPHLENLIKSMDSFAEAIKMTRRSNFNSAIESLKDSILKFHPVAGNLNDAMMDLLQKRIKSDYEKLFEKDVLTPIEWCLKHDYVQQALMLYTESVPPFLFTENILQISEDSLQSVINAKGDDRSDPYVYLFNNYKPNMRKVAFDNRQSICDTVYEFLSLLKQKETDKALEKQAELEKILKNKGVGRRDIANCNNVMEALLALAGNPELEVSADNEEQACITVPLKKYFKPGNKGKAKGVFSTIANEIAMIKKSNNKNSFNTVVDLLCYEKPKKNIENGIQKQFNLHMKKFRVVNLYNLFYQQVIAINEKIEEKSVYEAMQMYFDIKDIRNDSAHANINVGNHAIESSEELKNYMETGIRMLREMRDELH